MNDSQSNKRKNKQRRLQIWLAIGAVILIFLLLFWVDIVDIAGGGDGAAMISLI